MSSIKTVATDIAYYIPPKYQKKLFTLLATVGLILGATAAGFVAAGAGLPTALIVANAVFVYVSTATHFVARVNAPSETPSEPA